MPPKNFCCCQVIALVEIGKQPKSDLPTHPPTSRGIYLRLKMHQVSYLWKVKIQTSSSCCAWINVFPLMKCFPFLLTKEPLDVIGAVQCPGAGSVLRHSLQWICKLENLLQPRPIQKQNSNSRSNIDTKIFKSKYFIKSLLENCFLVREKLPTIFVNVKKVLFH